MRKMTALFAGFALAVLSIGLTTPAFAVKNTISTAPTTAPIGTAGTVAGQFRTKLISTPRAALGDRPADGILSMAIVEKITSAVSNGSTLDTAA